MGLFGKRDKTVDLTNHYIRQKDRAENIKDGIKRANDEKNSAPTASGFGFLREMATSSVQTIPAGEETSDDVKRKLAKRLADITERLEDLSTQIYHLQQRVELLEIKNKSGYD